MMELFPNSLTENQCIVMAEIYKNPYANTKNIIKATGISGSASYSAFKKMMPKRKTHTRFSLFYDLGYINIPTFEDLHKSYNYSIPEIYQGILKQFSNQPDIPNEEIGRKEHLTLSTINGYIWKMYPWFGFYAKKAPNQLTRLEFYEYMGWFDVNQLKQDAEDQYATHKKILDGTNQKTERSYGEKSYDRYQSAYGARYDNCSPIKKNTTLFQNKRYNQSIGKI